MFFADMLNKQIWLDLINIWFCSNIYMYSVCDNDKEYIPKYSIEDLIDYIKKAI